MQPAQTEGDDVLVIGGGVIGLSVALALLRAGRSVRVLERSHVGAGASHGNCGTLTPSHAPPLAAPGVLRKAVRWMRKPDAPLYIRPRLDPALWAWLLHFAARCNVRDWQSSTRHRASLLNASQSLLRELIAREGLQCEYAQTGLTYVFREASLLQEYLDELPALQSMGIANEVIDGARLESQEPALKSGVAGGITFPDDCHLRPDRYLAELQRCVEALGGVIECGVELCRVETSAGQVCAIHTLQGRRAARDVVLATGAWSPLFARNLGLRLPIQPGKGYSITWSRPPLVPSRPLVLKERSVCVTTWESGFRLGSTMEFSGYDRSLNRVRLDALIRGAGEYLHTPVGEELREEWYGWRPMTWDDLPLLGAVPDRRGLWLACGHGMMGVSMSAVTGHLLADLICGRTPVVDPTPFDPTRFSR